MAFSVLPVLIPDIPQAFDAYFAAFQADPEGQVILDLLFPGGVTDEFRRAHAAAVLGYWHTADTQYTFKCVDNATGETVGMLLCDMFFRERSAEERQNPGITWLEGEQRKRAESVVNPLWEMREKLWGGRRYIYIHVFAVHPKHQKRGAGTTLVQFVVDMAETTGLPVYLEATQSSVRLYERLGFKRIPETVVHKAEVLGAEADVEVPLLVKLPRQQQPPSQTEKGLIPDSVASSHQLLC